MATNTVATKQTHTAANNASGNTSGPYAISFDYLLESDVEVRVNSTLKTQTTHYTFPSKTSIQFTSGNFPTLGTTIEIKRNTDITVPKVDFQDGSVLTESDLDNNSKHLLFGMQETKEETESLVSTFVGSTPPTDVVNGARWYDTVSGRTFVYYQDVDTAQWVEASPPFDATEIATESSFINFTASATSAVTRTVKSKLEDIVSLKDFGVTGDGVADDSAKVKAAHDAAVAAGVKIVLVPDGTYNIPECKNSDDTHFGIDDVIWITKGNAKFINGPRTRIHLLTNSQISVLGNITPERHLRNFNSNAKPVVMITGDSLSTDEAQAINGTQTFWGMLKSALKSQNLGIEPPTGSSSTPVTFNADNEIKLVNAGHGGGTFTQFNETPSQKPTYVSDAEWTLNNRLTFGSTTNIAGWSSATTYSTNDFVYNGDSNGANIYQAAGSISSGGTAPTHTVGTVNNWTFKRAIKTQLEWIRTYNVLNTQTFTATAGQTVFTTTYDWTPEPTQKEGTYSQSGTDMTLTIADHGFSIGDVVFLDYTSGSGVSGFFTILSNSFSTGSFKVTASNSATNSGRVAIRYQDSNRSEIAVYVDDVWQSPKTYKEGIDNGIGDKKVIFNTGISVGQSVRIEKVTCPDTLFIYYGMNDKQGFVASQFIAAMNKIERWSQYAGPTSGFSPMNKEPDLIFVSNVVPSRMVSNNTNISDDDSQNGRDQVAHFVRTYAMREDFGLIDLNRKYNLIREGYDVTSQFLTKKPTTSPANLPLSLASTRDYFIKLTLNVNLFTQTLSFLIGETLNTKCFVDLTRSGQNITVTAKHSQIYLNKTFTGAAPSSGNLTIEFSVLNGTLFIEFYNASNDLLATCEEKVIRTGGLYIPTISFTPPDGVDALTHSVDFEYYVGDYTPYTPTVTDADLWSNNRNSGGNDINHPDSPSAQLLYHSVLKNTNFSQTITNSISDAGELKTGIGTSNPQGFLHVTKANDEVLGASNQRVIPASDSNIFVLEGSSVGKSDIIDTNGAVRYQVKTKDGERFKKTYNDSTQKEITTVASLTQQTIGPVTVDYERTANIVNTVPDLVGNIKTTAEGGITWNLNSTDNNSRDIAQFSLDAASKITFENYTAAVERVIKLYVSNAGNALTIEVTGAGGGTITVKWKGGSNCSTYTGSNRMLVTLTFIGGEVYGHHEEYS